MVGQRPAACGVVPAPAKTTTVPRIYLRWHRLSERGRAVLMGRAK